MSSTPNNSTNNNNDRTPSKKKKKMNSSATGDINIKIGRGSLSPKRETGNVATATTTPNRENNNGEATTPQSRVPTPPTGFWAPRSAVIEDDNSPGRDGRDDRGTFRSNDNNSTAENSQQDEVKPPSQAQTDEELWRQLNEMKQTVALIPALKGEIATLKEEVARIPYLEGEVARIPYLEEEVARIPSLEQEVARIPYLEGEVARISYLEGEVARIPSLEKGLDKVEEKLCDLEEKIVRFGEPIFVEMFQRRYYHIRHMEFKTLSALLNYAEKYQSRWDDIVESEDKAKPGFKLRDLKVLVPVLQHFRDKRNKACHEMIFGHRTQSKDNIRDRIQKEASPNDVNRIMKSCDEVFGEIWKIRIKNPSPQKPSKK